ncbi:MAG: PAS domain-containing protein [Proteobacteria bacterium]|nr:PAS domain-containing protein [Pseudomonadota bacterium]
MSLIIWLFLCVGLYLTSLYSYLLFHIVAESFSIVIVFSLFMISWNTRRLSNNNYVLFLGIAFLFAGLIDFAHTLAYKGMGIFRGFDANLPTQLWIMARYVQSLSLLAAPWFINRKLNPGAIIGFYLSVTLILLAAAFSNTFFPDCFIEGKGLTPFKIVSEYVICLILISSLALLLHHRESFNPKIMRLLIWSILFTILSELAFTFYISVFGLSNLIGHYFKIFSFYLIYQAIIVTGLENPYSLLFFDLQKHREELQIIIDSSPIMIFYKDREARFIRVNKALAKATGLPRDEIEGKKDFEIYPTQRADYWEDDKEVIVSGKPKTGIIEPINTPTGTKWVQTDKIPYRDNEGQIIGIIGFAVDITERKKAEEENERLILELREALSKVKLLSGLLPICASCKKIRNDNGYWEQMEMYVRDHSEADFSHGICPECAEKLYPEYYKKK